MKPKTVALCELGLLALCVGLFLWWIYPPRVTSAPEVRLVTEQTASSTRPTFAVSGLQAKSVYVYDTVTKEALFELNPDLQLPLASITKVMTAYTASKLVPTDKMVRISRSDLGEEGDSGLSPNEEWDIKDLIDFSLIVSSNDGARALASVAGALTGLQASTSPIEAFVRQMNINAQKLGLHETYYLNESGLDVSTALSGGYGSARDTALLVDQVLREKPHLLEATSFDKLKISSKLAAHVAVNTNKVINSIPNVLASKTGYTDLSGGNLVIAFDAGVGHPVIISVLGSTLNGRFEDMAQLVGSTIQYLAGE
jgi:D-alanyl-D-alanine carboxypeptidase